MGRRQTDDERRRLTSAQEGDYSASLSSRLLSRRNLPPTHIVEKCEPSRSAKKVYFISAIAGTAEQHAGNVPTSDVQQHVASQECST